MWDATDVLEDKRIRGPDLTRKSFVSVHAVRMGEFEC